MAILRMRELNEMDAKTLSGKLAELKRELTIERSSAAGVGRSVNPGRIKTLKRTIARILTVAKVKGLKLEVVKPPKPKAEPKAVEKKEAVKPEAKAEKKATDVSPNISEIMGEVQKKSENK